MHLQIFSVVLREVVHRLRALSVHCQHVRISQKMCHQNRCHHQNLRNSEWLHYHHRRNCRWFWSVVHFWELQNQQCLPINESIMERWEDRQQHFQKPERRRKLIIQSAPSNNRGSETSYGLGTSLSQLFQP